MSRWRSSLTFSFLFSSHAEKRVSVPSLACNAWVSKWTDVSISDTLHRSNFNFSLANFPVLFCFPLSSLLLLQPTTVISLSLSLVHAHLFFLHSSSSLCWQRIHSEETLDTHTIHPLFFPYLFFYLWAEGMTDRVLSTPLSLELLVYSSIVTGVQNIDSLFFLLFLVEWLGSIVLSWDYLAFAFLLIMLAHSPSFIPFLQLSPPAVPSSSTNTNNSFQSLYSTKMTTAVTETTATHVVRAICSSSFSLDIHLLCCPPRQNQKSSSKHQHLKRRDPDPQKLTFSLPLYLFHRMTNNKISNTPLTRSKQLLYLLFVFAETWHRTCGCMLFACSFFFFCFVASSSASSPGLQRDYLVEGRAVKKEIDAPLCGWFAFSDDAWSSSQCKRPLAFLFALLFMLFDKMHVAKYRE